MKQLLHFKNREWVLIEWVNENKSLENQVHVSNDIPHIYITRKDFNEKGVADIVYEKKHQWWILTQFQWVLCKNQQ